jgi:hypothetical protein
MNKTVTLLPPLESFEERSDRMTVERQEIIEVLTKKIHKDNQFLLMDEGPGDIMDLICSAHDMDDEEFMDVASMIERNHT